MKDNWAFRRIGMDCNRCIFFVQKPTEVPVKTTAEGEASNNLGRCRRHAPCQVVLGWPCVFEQDWCGDFKLDENKI